ncbi:MAG: ATP-binding cassette domain-containing protein [Gemmatimonas sp.]|nr:ATP-binding cassette domain-containing protein [Gemmatimonas sp.]
MKELLTLLPYLRRYRVRIAIGLFAVVLANAFSLAAPYLIKEAIDALEQQGATRDVIVRYVLLILGTAIVAGAARFTMRQILNGVSRWVEFDLRNRFFQQLLHLDAAFFGRMSTGEIMSRATNDIAAVRMVAGPAYMYLVNTFAVSLFALTLMIWIDPWLTLVSMIPMLALPPVTLGFGKLIHERFEAIQERFGTMSTMVQENLAGVRIVKAYGQEERHIDRFGKVATDYLERNLSLARVSGLFHPLLALFSGVAMASVLLVGGRSVIQGSMSVGDLVAFTLYLGMLTWPMIALGWVVNLFQRGAASMRRINEILNTHPAVTDPFEVPAHLVPRGEIEFRNVSFRYPGTRRLVLRNVSFCIPAGGMLAVVGATGSGKSTLVSLLVRLYDPSEGEILLDGTPIRQIDLESLRSSIGMVPQEAFLFSDTIRENLSIGFDYSDARHGERRVRQAATIAQLDSAVLNLPKGYDTLLGERGVNLSGGQKQRATLARAIARDPAVLVLDDALSAVDTHTEAEILRGLRTVLRERTSVVVSHRVSAVLDADLILVLDDGEVVERGTHVELLKLGGTYAKLLRRQLLAEEVGEEGVLAGAEGDI